MSGEFESRYPDYDALADAEPVDWDEQTWRAVQDRITDDPSARFFTDSERITLEAIADRIIPQPDRAGEEKVPIVRWIDEKLFHDRRDGYRYERMPPQRIAWRGGIEGVNQTSLELHGRTFADLPSESQDEVLRAVEAGHPRGAAWDSVPAALFFRSVLCVTMAKAYYSHPTAWSEIGYSGPSSPRGHVRNWIGGVDAWEPHERPTLWKTE
jgi:hypothetical protein